MVKLGTAIGARRRFAPTAHEKLSGGLIGELYRQGVELSPEEEAWVYDETPSPCPVCGVGPEQSSDSKRMWTSVCYCGHPRYWDYKVRLQQLKEREGQPGPPGVKPDEGTQQGRGAD